MLNRQLFGIILANAIFMAGLSLFTVWTYYRYQSWALLSFPVSLVFLQIFGFTYYLNRRNKQLTTFLTSIEQEDTAIRFPTEVKNEPQRLLHTQLNRVNQILQDIKLKHGAQEQYYRTLLDQASTGILAINTKGQIPTINQKALELMGRRYLRHQDQLAEVDRQLYQTIKDIRDGEKQLLALRTEDQLVQLMVSSSSIISLGESFKLISLQDIRNELDKKELDAWIRLIRVITHEIANTIGPVLSLSRGMQKRLAEWPSGDHTHFLQEALNIITERGENLSSFITRYRRLMKVPTPVLKAVSPISIIDKLRILVSHQLAEGGIKLHVNKHVPAMDFYVDEGLFTQALLNLIKNAAEAMQSTPDGQISIQVRLDQNRLLRWEVMDNGPGLPAENLEDIFVPFFTNKEEGSGIGLNIARQIVRLHSGTLTAQNRPKGGALLRIVLPLQADAMNPVVQRNSLPT